MEDMLSQAEIDALLNGSSSEGNEESSTSEDLTSQEIDALGEIGNISMGTSATTLNSLLGQRVVITTPTVSVCTWEELANEYHNSYVAVKVEYTEGLDGMNLLLLKEDDAKVITDLMMGGDGTNKDGDLNDLHLSAISEAMNQMIGSAATSMSSMFNKRIDISPPKAFPMTLNDAVPETEFPRDQKIVKVAFKMVIGELIDSQIMQLLPIDFARAMVNNIMNSDSSSEQAVQEAAASAVQAPVSQQYAPQEQYYQAPQQQYPQPPQQQYQQPYPPYEQPARHNDAAYRNPINVQPAQFEAFDDGSRISIEKKNIGLIMDVPLQVTVELGRTNKLIKDILEFGPGSIIELDKLAGEPVDILVNGKVIAIGEVVVIDESFGVRITDILHPSKRL
ncbi:MAG TPA: flagellar motor switch phosphatase FliY [Acetivibrio sp.]|uniref:flagellar motor switch phosphatase FliY n=1 Tax=Acetivibrio sp. TaxID=1872092 RepID=UPI002C397163|nr:flagellar motor switch phosphatase FliY [Acetivibrio sp.]HOM02066.1 flagellar motor switch phosphatase FliY [Acetivibrio sp.]